MANAPAYGSCARRRLHERRPASARVNVREPASLARAGRGPYLRWMTRWVHVAALALALVGCGPDKVGPVALGEVCGVAGPSRLFALAPDVVLRSRARPFLGQMF